MQDMEDATWLRDYLESLDFELDYLGGKENIRHRASILIIFVSLLHTSLIFFTVPRSQG